MTQETKFDFKDTREPREPFMLYDNVLEDRGSKYAVSIGRVTSREDIKRFLKQLSNDKRYRKATHHSWAARITETGRIVEHKNDDGEAGAGMIILRMLQKHHAANCVVCVTRWFGGTKLMGDRFRNVQTAAEHALERI